jgi:hypothetical protein
MANSPDFLPQVDTGSPNACGRAYGGGFNRHAQPTAAPAVYVVKVDAKTGKIVAGFALPISDSPSAPGGIAN